MTQYYSRKDYNYAGDSNFTIPFSYIDKDDISVYVNDEAITTFTWLNDSQINVTSTLTTGDIISIRRNTPIDEKIVTYQNMSMVLSDDNLNLSQDQVLNAVQEIYDNNVTFEIDVNSAINTIDGKADSAISTANNAVTTANSANSKADNAVSTANTASSNASAAVNTANTANSNASTAVSTANTALSTANTASSNASTALSTANTAKSTADSALEKSNTAISTANTASSTANTASTNASNAVSTANTASSNASTALSNSQTALSTANTAKNTADSASETATSASNKVDDFGEDIAAVIEAAEKIDELEEAVQTAVEAAATASDAAETVEAIMPAQTGKNGKYLKTNGTTASWESVDSFPTQSGNSGKFLTTNGTDVSWANVDALPTQTGKNGKFLQTNGSTASWETVDALPSQTGQSGKYLTTNGSTASWNTITMPTVDQTYDSTSTNAQSGVAVAQALGTVEVSIDNTSITKNSSNKLQTVGIIDARSNNTLKAWTGTKAQYDAIATKDANTRYDITDDVSNNNSIVVDLNGKADVDLTNCTVPYVISRTPNSQGGVVEIWSDGYCVQNGNFSPRDNNTTITFSPVYVNTPYISFTNAGYNMYRIDNIDNSHFTITDANYGATNKSCSWEAKGYIR